MAGGVGFSFVPTFNLQVTGVAYMSKPYADPIVSFWSGANLIGRKLNRNLARRSFAFQ